jgi:hypothetical protein
MDREPAFDYGVSPDRRALDQAREAVAEVAGDTYRVLAEGLQHVHRYPTLVSASTGRRLLDESERVTAVAQWHGRAGELPLVATVIGQSEHRSHEGANQRWPESLTFDRSSQAILLQLGTELDLLSGRRLRLQLGWGYKSESEVARRNAPLVTDMEEEWLWMERPRSPEALDRMRFDGVAELALAPHWRLSLRANGAHLTSLPTIVGGLTGTTYARGATTPVAPVAVALVEWEEVQQAEEWLANLRWSADGRLDLAGFEVRLHAGLDVAAVGVPGTTRLSFLSPAAGVSMVRPVGAAELFALVRHEPDPLTVEVAAFLDRARPAGEKRVWHDDGDQIPEASEAGALLARVGGRYHRKGELDRPTSSQLAFGVRSGQFGAFRASLTFSGRLHVDRFTVVYNREVAESFVRVPIDDPGGDGRGEGESDQVAWRRLPGSEGRELYLLTNSSRFDYFAGAAIQLYTVTNSWWFLNLGAVGYWSVGNSPFGAFPDRNDQGVIDEVSADPNSRVNQHGRPDSDRSFAINLLAGIEPLEGLSASVAIRYRDGQPFTRFLVVEDLPQGPTPVMTVWRGAVRHTFHMTLDARLRYRFPLGNLQAAVAVDGSNLLGSSVELLEDPRTGEEFRRSLEMIPGRTVGVSLEISVR